MRTVRQQILIGVGSNVDAQVHVPLAVSQLRSHFSRVRVSTFYLTKPLKDREQPPYTNGVVAALTAHPPDRVRAILAGIETRAGRRRNPRDRYASRTLDLDLLAYGDLVDASRELPGADLVERDFVLVPAAELLPGWLHPTEGLPLRDLAAKRFPKSPNTLIPAELNLATARRLARTAARSRGRGVILLMVAVAVLLGGVAGLAQAGGPGTPGGGLGGTVAALPAVAGVAGPSVFWRVLGRLALLVGAAYAGLSLYMFFFQARFVYFPDRNLAGTPEQNLGVKFEGVRLPTPDGRELHAWFVPAAAHERGVVLFCHGNGGNISYWLDMIEILRGLEFSVFIFDYRGYGESTGRPGENGTYIDAGTAWCYLTNIRGIPPAKIVIHGQSLGGPIAAWLASTEKPGALVVESTFTSLPDMARGLYPYLPVGLLCRYRYATRDYLVKVEAPVVVIHSPDDEIVPYRFGEALFAAAREPKRFIRIRGTHNEGYLESVEAYAQGLDAALSPYFPRAADSVDGQKRAGATGSDSPKSQGCRGG